jgi:hypothetical protein
MVDGHAAPAESALAHAHLARCGRCRAAADRLFDLTRRLRIHTANDHPDSAGRVLAAFEAQWFEALQFEPPWFEALWPDGVRAPRPALDVGQETPAAGRTRLSCLPAHATLWTVGAAACGCPPGCGCGCQSGRACRCVVATA